MTDDELVKRLRRYDAVLHYKAGQWPYVVMSENAEGDYCEYTQAADAIGRLQADLKEAVEALRPFSTESAEWKCR